jgi:hypothetical protein
VIDLAHERAAEALGTATDRVAYLSRVRAALGAGEGETTLAAAERVAGVAAQMTADRDALAAEVVRLVARAEKAEAEVESWGGHSFAVQTELDAAWAAAEVPVRGMVPLAEVVASFRDDRAALRAKVARLEKQIAAAREALAEQRSEVPHG